MNWSAIFASLATTLAAAEAILLPIGIQVAKDVVVVGEQIAINALEAKLGVPAGSIALHATVTAPKTA